MWGKLEGDNMIDYGSHFVTADNVTNLPLTIILGTNKYIGPDISRPLYGPLEDKLYDITLTAWVTINGLIDPGIAVELGELTGKAGVNTIPPLPDPIWYIPHKIDIQGMAHYPELKLKYVQYGLVIHFWHASLVVNEVIRWRLVYRRHQHEG